MSSDDPTELPSTEVAPVLPEHQQIGPYRLREKLGEGGMGEVWLAEQTEPVRRRVALKIIKRGMDTERVVARFQAERQALALMNHANVAKVFDAGTTPNGRPYFAMEHVQGVPITEHCDRHRLNTRQRLELFRQVCAGVQHAHQKGIIHRDLKPTNVLVQVQDSERVPKIIDFGVAKATQQRLTEQTLYTELGQLIGTPEYMSPEQAEMTAEDIDTRTDVYSLGVLLYELLVGALPFDSRELRRAGFDEIRRRIREQEPSRPSQKVSTLGDLSVESAHRRQTDVLTLRRQLRGDLDCIVMKSLEKDRTRRYGSPQELASDIGRYLSHEPVLASPPSVAYRARKFVRRHRVGVGVAALLLGMLVAFTVTTMLQSRRIAREARTSERVSEFLADMLSEVEPDALGQFLVTDLRERVETLHRERGATDEEVAERLASFEEAMRGVNATDAGLRLLDTQVLGRAAQMIERRLGEEPRIAGRLEHTLGETYSKLGLSEQAKAHARRAVEIREELLGPLHRETLASKSQLGWDLAWMGRHTESEPLLRETLKDQRRVLGSEHHETAATLFRLGVACGIQGKYAEAEALYREALELQRRLLGDEHPATLRSMSAVASAIGNQGRLDEAEALHVEALEIKRRVLGLDDMDTLRSTYNLAHVYQRQGRYSDAESLYLEGLEVERRIFGDRHRITLQTMHSLARVYEKQGRHAEAEAYHVEALAIGRNTLGDDHPQTLSAMYELAYLYQSRKRFADSEALYLELLEIERRVRGDAHTETLGTLNSLAELYRRQGRYGETEALHIEALAARRDVLGDDHLSTIQSMYNLALVYRDQGRNAEAEPFFLETLEAERRVRSEDHRSTLVTMKNLAGLYESQSRYAEAEPLRVEILEIRRRVLGDEDGDTIFAIRALADLYWAQDRSDEARSLYSELISTRKRQAEIEGADAFSKNAYAMAVLTCPSADLRDPRAALRFALQANEMTGFENAHLLDTLARAYHQAGETAKAVEMQRKALESLTSEGRRAKYERRLAEFEAALRGDE